MEFVLILIYEVWAVYSGYRVMSGRIGWLEENGIINKIIKFGVCWFIGNLIAAFYLLYAIFKLLIAFVS